MNAPLSGKPIDIRGFDGSLHGQAYPYKPPAAPAETKPTWMSDMEWNLLQEQQESARRSKWVEDYRAKVGLPQVGGGPTTKPSWVSDAEWSSLMQAKHYNEFSKLANSMSGQPAGQTATGPSDLVGGSFVNGLSTPGTSRWKVDNERRMADLEYQKAVDEAEQRRWMMEQMRRNPMGMSIRDLIFGAGGK